MRPFPYFALLCQSTALLITRSIRTTSDIVLSPLSVAAQSSLNPSTLTTTPRTVLSRSSDTSTVAFTYSTLVTMAPLSRNPLDARQKCFDDRGFSVDCATWTGYYYTWGPSGNLYQGGPGDSNGAGSNVYSSATSHFMPLAVSYIILVNIITLWAALSLS